MARPTAKKKPVRPPWEGNTKQQRDALTEWTLKQLNEHYRSEAHLDELVTDEHHRLADQHPVIEALLYNNVESAKKLLEGILGVEDLSEFFEIHRTIEGPPRKGKFSGREANPFSTFGAAFDAPKAFVAATELSAPAADRVKIAVKAVGIVRDIWKKHYGKSRRSPNCKPSAERIASKYWGVPVDQIEKRRKYERKKKREIPTSHWGVTPRRKLGAP